MGTARGVLDDYDRSVEAGREGGVRRRIAILVLGLSLSALMPAAVAGAAWILPPSNLSSVGFNSTTPDVAIGPDGRTVIVWATDTGVGSLIRAATRSPGANGFSAPVDVTLPGTIEDPRVVVAPNGTTTVIWTEFINGKSRIRSATRAAGTNVFSIPVNISGANDSAFSPVITGGPTGETTVLWTGVDNQSSQAYVAAATRPAGSSSFGAPDPLSDIAQPAIGWDIETGPDGRTTAIWTRSDGSNAIVQARTRAAGDFDFAPTANLSVAGQSASDPKLAFGRDGATTVVWTRSDGSKDRVQATTRPAGSNQFSAPLYLSEAGQSTDVPQVTMGSEDETTVVWRHKIGNDWVLRARTRPAGFGSFLAPEDISTAEQKADNQTVATGPDGSTTVVWSGSNGFNSIVQAATRPAGAGSFRSPVPLSAAGQDAGIPRFAAGPCDGSATVVWSRSNGANEIVQEATDRCSGKLTSIEVKGPGSVSRRGKSGFRVEIRNAGPGTALGLVLEASGKGIKASKKAGNLAAGTSKTFKLPLEFKKKGKIKVTFTVTSKNAGKKTVKKVVRVG